MFEPKIMNFVARLGWWRGHLLLAINEVFFSLERLMICRYVMLEGGGQLVGVNGMPE